MADQRVFRGAKVRKDAPRIPIVERHSHVSQTSVIGYQLALENRRKNWAKRWFRQHKPGKLI